MTQPKPFTTPLLAVASPAPAPAPVMILIPVLAVVAVVTLKVFYFTSQCTSINVINAVLICGPL